MKKLALVGYGKMGRLIEQLAPQYDFEVALRLDAKNNAGGAAITPDTFAGIDVAIEFSSPEAAPLNLAALAAAGVPAVTGTTGWLDHLEMIQQQVEQHGTGLVWAANFSVGVAVFTQLAELAADLLAQETEYGAWAWEIHHDTKKDAPSGTLLHLVGAMRDRGFLRNIDVAASRAGRHPGTHEIGFDSPADTITLRHTARSRAGFGEGALKAARWILDHKGTYTFNDVLFGSRKR